MSLLSQIAQWDVDCTAGVTGLPRQQDRHTRPAAEGAAAARAAVQAQRHVLGSKGSQTCRLKFRRLGTEQRYVVLSYKLLTDLQSLGAGKPNAAGGRVRPCSDVC